jgi:hypothetical protein
VQTYRTSESAISRIITIESCYGSHKAALYLQDGKDFRKGLGFKKYQSTDQKRDHEFYDGVPLRLIPMPDEPETMIMVPDLIDLLCTAHWDFSVGNLEVEPS